MYGLFINLGIQVLSRVASRYKFFGWWMIIAFLWASAIAWQLPPPYRGSHQFEDVVTESSPEQYCAKAPLEKRDECLRVAKSVDRILGPTSTAQGSGALHIDGETRAYARTTSWSFGVWLRRRINCQKSSGDTLGGSAHNFGNKPDDR